MMDIPYVIASEYLRTGKIISKKEANCLLNKMLSASLSQLASRPNPKGGEPV